MPESPADFHRLESRLRLSGELVTRTGLHIGSGAVERDAMDMPVLRDAEGYPFIPGASLKGVLRSTLESLVRAASSPERGIWSCDPLNEEEGASDRACGAHKKGQRENVDPTKHCAVCRLFGSRIVASHVRISDSSVLVRGEVSPVELRDGVAIDRDLKVVHGSLKYDFEVVCPGTAFGLEVFVENPKDWLVGLLTLGFDQVADGFTAVGGFTSRGLGRMDLKWTGLRRFTASSLLKGEPPQEFEGDALVAEMSRWRRALADRVEGGQDV